jgi:hypothetical protein
MGLKTDIRKAITTNTKYNVVKVWKPEISGKDYDGTQTMTLEITIRQKKKHIN